MLRLLFFCFYYPFLLLFLLLCLPSYLIKMKRRGGFGSGLLERFGIYRCPASEEAKGGLYIHAVSVGETFIALKFIREWQKTHQEPVQLAVSTSTGHQVAKAAGLKGVRVLYAPFDLAGLPERCLTRFAPCCVALIEAELWPHFARVCRRRAIPLVMLNARLSARSEGRYAKVRPITRLLFSYLNAMGVQNQNDALRFERIGVQARIIELTGSIKFDLLGDKVAQLRDDFVQILDKLRDGRPIILAASTHAGEEALIAQAARKVGGFPLIIPRHAERRDEVLQDLRAAGFKPLLRTQAQGHEQAAQYDCYVADTTGELRDWTQLAQLVVIGKSFLAQGGQNPVEAIAAGVPVIVGPQMNNFADLVQLLLGVEGISQCGQENLAAQMEELLHDEARCQRQTQAARECLVAHAGACQRSVELVERSSAKQREEARVSSIA